ncbi:hypothetical protein ACPHXT_003974 [Vibrio alginolyticus]
MEFWKAALLWLCVFIVKSLGLIWSINELFGLNVEYSLMTIAASSVLIFCITGTRPAKAEVSARREMSHELSSASKSN